MTYLVTSINVLIFGVGWITFQPIGFILVKNLRVRVAVEVCFFVTLINSLVYLGCSALDWRKDYIDSME